MKLKLEIKKEETIRLETILQTQYEELYNLISNNQEYDVVKNALSHQSLRATEAAKIQTTRKLNNLHRHGNIVLPNESNNFLNLSDYVLTDDEINILNLGLNCHYQPKFNIMDKKIEL